MWQVKEMYAPANQTEALKCGRAATNCAHAVIMLLLFVCSRVTAIDYNSYFCWLGPNYNAIYICELRFYDLIFILNEKVMVVESMLVSLSELWTL